MSIRRLLLTGIVSFVASPVVASTLTVQSDAINGVLISSDNSRISVYGWDKADNVSHVLLTHGRRDVVWKAETAIAAGAYVVAPTSERYLLTRGAEFWKNFRQTQFHNYAQQSTKICAHEIAVDQWVEDGQELRLGDITLKVLNTPGYTRGACSYVTQIDGRTIVFSGDLITADGRIPDLYSFQDAIPEAQIRGYHGYGARLADLLKSLQKIRDLRPDVLIPCRGPVIDSPLTAIDRLMANVREVYQNYLSTNALHWYFKRERMEICGRRILGPDADIELMPYCHHQTTPDWIFEKGTSRLLISDSGRGFLLDCGNKAILQEIQRLIADDVISSVDGIFVTHYHDDHTDSVQAAAEAFQCPVYALPNYADVLKNPEAWHLPAMTGNAVSDVTIMQDGQLLQWHEFALTFYVFPGQTFFHGALLAKKSDERPVFFIGDAFAPSGLDDYCVLNRNLLGDDKGYLYCLKKLRELKRPWWLVNQHIPWVFEYSDEELDFLDSRYRDRIKRLQQLFPFDDPNYGVDEQWAVLYPRRQQCRAGHRVQVELRISNYSPKQRTFRVSLNCPADIDCAAPVRDVTIVAGAVGKVIYDLQVNPGSDIRLLTADLADSDITVRRWADAVLYVD